MRPEVGKPVSDIVGKLMSKNAEDRYQGNLFLFLFLNNIIELTEYEHRLQGVDG